MSADKYLSIFLKSNGGYCFFIKIFFYKNYFNFVAWPYLNLRCYVKLSFFS